ncbi:Rho GTPase-activating protein 26, partial [Fulmarus glacialis]
LADLSAAKRKFADSLNEFKFRCIGDAETDDEICIAKSLQEFATVLRNLEDERMRMVRPRPPGAGWVVAPLLPPASLPADAKKKYDKETEKYCGVLEKHLNLSSKKKESQLQE